MDIAVMGAGGVGGYFGGLLARAGHNVTFIARGAHLDAMRRNGLRVISTNDGDFTVAGKATDNPGEIGTQELILFTVKMYHNDDAIHAIAPMVGPDSIVLTLQNGIDNGDRLVDVYGAERVMIGSAYLEGRISEPGVVTQGGPGAASFGERTPGITERGERLLDVFQGANWRVELLENMTGMLWKKFAYLSGSAGVCAASGCTYGELRTVPETRAAIEAAIAEALAVGEASGAPLEPDSLEWSMNALDNFPAAGMASLAKDFAEDRPVELEGLTGTVIRLGKQYGVPTPVNNALYAVLKPRANRIETALGG
ncbi:MAG: 2-dehydropantoate 2-reductase [Chloroflexota bacterium]|nr:2-dehydropantoate 2-reductase [Chloroflexota bacterium]MDE2683231.1 2-dehydropantoate 2-reductase [Chloroflexota bacterium]